MEFTLFFPLYQFLENFPAVVEFIFSKLYFSSSNISSDSATLHHLSLYLPFIYFGFFYAFLVLNLLI
jgi:hypothetical protein